MEMRLTGTGKRCCISCLEPGKEKAGHVVFFFSSLLLLKRGLIFEAGQRDRIDRIMPHHAISSPPSGFVESNHRWY